MGYPDREIWVVWDAPAHSIPSNSGCSQSTPNSAFSFFLDIQPAFFSLIGITRQLLWRRRWWCNYCPGNQDLPGLLYEHSHSSSGFSASTALLIPREEPEKRQVEMWSDLDWTLVQYSTCTRLIAHTKIKITLTVCLIALRPVIARTFPVPVLLETIQAPLISMEANLCAH